MSTQSLTIGRSGIFTKKYDTDFNFYCAKSINQIVYNETLQPATIQYKDIAVLSERNEYLKRIYHMRNLAGRNQIYDRVNMLADFYANTVLMRYEHPLMIVTNTKNIFIKRLRRMKKMIASDCSSDESSSIKSQHSQQALSFESSGFLNSIKTRELSSKSHSQSKCSISEAQKQYSGSVHDIYQQIGPFPLITRFSVIRSESIQDKILDCKHSPQNLQEPISHLIIDIDDVNKQKAMHYYHKIQQHQNKNANILNFNKSKKPQKSSIIITPIDNYVPKVNISESSFSKDEKYYPKQLNFNKKYTKKPEIAHRQYDQTLRVGDRYPRSSKIYQSPDNHQFLASRSPVPSFHSNSRYRQSKQTQREYVNIYDRYQIGKFNEDYRDERRIPSRSRIQTQQQILLTQNRYNHRKSDMDPHNYEHDRLVLNKQSRRMKKKEEIRQRAIALLRNVRSHGKLNYQSSRLRESEL